MVTSGFENIEACCANPELTISEDVGRMEMKMECCNCNQYHIVIIGMPIIDYWNRMIIERDRNKRDIASVDVNLYPYPFAMV